MDEIERVLFRIATSESSKLEFFFFIDILGPVLALQQRKSCVGELSYNSCAKIMLSSAGFQVLCLLWVIFE